MTEATLNFNAADHESDSGSTPSSVKSTTKKPRANSRKNFEELENKMDSRFAGFEEKLGRLMSLLESRTTEKNDTARQGSIERAVQPMSQMDSFQAGSENEKQDDEVSVLLSDKEKRNSFLYDDASDSSSHSHISESDCCEEENGRFRKLVKNSSELSKLFGDDVLPTSNKVSEGLIIDEAQKSILNKTWRTDRPDRVNAYSEAYKKLFPVHDSSEAFFQVPTLDESVETLLINKYGPKAVFGHYPQLQGKAMKSLEKIAFQGQTASRMGLIISCYLQQSLGSLLEKLQAKDLNVDAAIQLVKDIFAMSTKQMDQTARAGVFHHMIRRKAVLYDTGLNDCREYGSTVMGLPLTNEGVLGPKFDEKTKGMNDRQKMLKEALPRLTEKSKQYSTSASGSNYNSGQKRKVSYDQPQSGFKKPRSDPPRRVVHQKSATVTYSNQNQSNWRQNTTQKQSVSGFRIPKKTYNSA